MTIALWIASALLALLFLLSGGMKVVLPADKVPKQFPFSENVGLRGVRVIGVVEVLGAIGVILPQLTSIAPILAPIAAAGLAVIQLLAIIVHVRRGEAKQVPVNVVLLLLALFVSIGLFATI